MRQYYGDMYPKSLPLIAAVLVLLVAGGILAFVLTRPAPESSTPSETGGGAEKLHVEESGDYHQIDAYYPSETPLLMSAGVDANASAVFSMKTFAESEVRRFMENNVAEITVEDVAVIGLGGDRKYVLEVDYDMHVSPDTVSYVYHMYADSLGAHPNAYYRTFTFDLASGEELHLDDLFSTSDYLDVLSNESRTRLRATLGEDAAIDMLEAGTTAFSDNFQNFYLEGNAFVLLFPPYQVGPWAIGTQEVRIPRAELGNTLNAEYR